MANMFGALNRFIARLDSDPNATTPNSQTQQLLSPGQQSSSNTTSHYGFQILRNTNSTISLDPWFDFIIGLNGHNIENPDPALFLTELKNCAPGSNISLGVFGAKGSSIREIYIQLPDFGRGEVLGLALQWAPLAAVEDVWHILDVMPGSPADVAGLLPYSDYVIGSPDVADMSGDGGLGQVIAAFLEKDLRLWVYNQEYDVTRIVTIKPHRGWGGEGALGCVLGYGALHRIPAPLGEPATGPGETMFDLGGGGDEKSGYFHQGGAQDEASAAPPSEFLVPANMQNFGSTPGTSPPPPGPPPGGRAKKARAHHQTPAAGGLDDYFAEGEKKSRELEGGSATKAKTSGLPPPPPKAGAGGPPKATVPKPQEGEAEID